MIRAQGLAHRYPKGTLALAGVDLVVPRGECFGLIGANGAGKTTLLRVLATLLEPSAGRARIDGRDVVEEPLAVRRAIGYLPENLAVFPELSVADALDYSAAAYGFRGQDRRRRVAAAIALVDLGARRDEACGALSRGLRQRVCLARALVHDPPVLLLDEPSSGLDPAARVELRQVLRELTRSGKTTVISSHILPELAEMCTSIGILDRGRVVAAGKVEEVAARMRSSRELEVEVAGSAHAVAGVLRGRPGVKGVRVDGARAWVDFAGAREGSAELLRALVQAGIPVVSFAERRTSLEEIFLAVAGAEGGA